MSSMAPEPFAVSNSLMALRAGASRSLESWLLVSVSVRSGRSSPRPAIGQLIQQGRLTLTSTIEQVLPDYPNEQARAATVQQLLDHRAGVADFFGSDFSNLDPPTADQAGAAIAGRLSSSRGASVGR